MFKLSSRKMVITPVDESLENILTDDFFRMLAAMTEERQQPWMADGSLALFVSLIGQGDCTDLYA
jgi:hypothetical protein